MSRTEGDAGRPAGSAWAPLRRPGFRSVWAALLGSQLVNWMHNVGAVTVVAALSGSVTLIALVQTATSLPAVLFALPSGAAADIFDRRRLVLAAQTGMVAATATLAGLTLAGAISPAVVLALTFALGSGMATTILAYQAMTPDVAGRELLAPAVALNGVAINLARAAGPALAGVLVAAHGAGVLFAIETAALLVIMLVVFRLRVPVARTVANGERLLGAMRAGGRFVRFSPPVRSVLARAGSFSVCASALWALLPVVALGPLGLGSRGFGLLLACLGAGALSGAILLPRLRRRVALDGLVALGTGQLVLGLLVLAYVREPLVVAAALVPTGAAWLGVLSSLNTSAQRVAPAWVRARALASFQLVFQGGLALGSLAWGITAGAAGPRVALVGAAAGLAAGVAVGRRWPLPREDPADLSPASAWSEPAFPLEPAPSDGPVLVTLEYRIDRELAPEFVTTMDDLGRVRRAGGAYAWSLYEDLEEPGRFVETFMVDSWHEHLRQRERTTVRDQEIERRARSMHHGDGPPAVSHLLAAPAALRARARDRGSGQGAGDGSAP